MEWSFCQRVINGQDARSTRWDNLFLVVLVPSLRLGMPLLEANDGMKIFLSQLPTPSFPDNACKALLVDNNLLKNN